MRISRRGAVTTQSSGGGGCGAVAHLLVAEGDDVDTYVRQLGRNELQDIWVRRAVLLAAKGAPDQRPNRHVSGLGRLRDHHCLRPALYLGAPSS